MTKKSQAIAKPWDPALNWNTPNQATFSVVHSQLKNAATDRSPDTHPKLMTEANAGMMAMLAPRDGVETLLAIQAIQAHNAASECLLRAWSKGQPPALTDVYLARATKLQRVFREHVESIDKHRNGGRQQIVVQHVNVENGGQAVVAGNFDKGGGQG